MYFVLCTVLYRVLPLYFPRDKAEEDVAKILLPADTGDETGGALSLDRQIRIVSNLPLTGTSTPKSSRYVLVPLCTVNRCMMNSSNYALYCPLPDGYVLIPLCSVDG